MANSLLRGRPQRPPHRLARPLAALGLLLATAGAARAQTTNFSYTPPGSPQTYTVPAGITQLNVVATGAAGGGNRGNNKGGFGGVVTATITVVPGEVLTVVVGGQGADSNSNGGQGVSGGGAGGYNGGGTGAYTGGGGGGATDLRRAAANGSTGDYFTSRNALLVAGGGGAADSGPAGGNGGTPTGGNGVSGQGGPAGQGATTTALGGGYLGSNGTGGNGNPNNFNAAGGGGYYGGGGGGGAAGTFGTGLNGGGGGSSYVLPTGSSNVSYSLAATRTNGSLAITPVVPPTNNALAFDGADDYVALPASTPVPVGNSAYTIEAWIKPTSMGVYGIVGWGTYGTTNQVNALRLSPSGIINYWWGPDLIVNTPDLSGQWHHVAATFDGTTRTIYLDGVAKGSDTPGAHTVPNANNLRIGSTNSANGGNGEYFPGSIDEVRIYNAGLTQAQVQADMFSTSSALPASQVAYYNFDQGVAGGNNAGVTSLPNLASSANPGTLTNFALTGTSSNWVRSFPTITAINPTSGQPGSSVTLTGTNLTDATSFAFNNTAVSPFTTPTSDLTATVTVPTGAITGPVSVASATLTRYNGPSFTVLPADLVVTTTTTIPAGTYNSITVNSPGNATLAGNVTVISSVSVNSGATLNDGCFVISGAGSFTLAAGGTLGICNAQGLSATAGQGMLQNTGFRSLSLDASYVYNGTVAQVTGLQLPYQVRSLTTTNANNVIISNTVAVAQTVTVGGAGNLVSNSALTLLSSASGTALVVNSGTGVVQGTVTVQRYIAGSNSGNGYRHYSAPVSNTTVGDLTTSGFAPVLTQAYNTSTDPKSVRPFPNVFGYDQSLLNRTNTSDSFDKGWVVPASTATAMTPGLGYAVNIAGTQLVDFAGTLGNGNVSVPVARAASSTLNAADAGYQLLGNPYPAPLDLSQMTNAFTAADLVPAAYIYASSGPYAGSYRSYTNGVPATNNVVAVGQGFFMRKATAGTSSTLTYTNAHRLTSYASQGTFSRTTADLRPLVQLDLVGGGLSDALYAYAEAGATPALDGRYDAGKLPNPTGLNLSSTATSGEALAIDGRPAFTAATELPLQVGVPAAGTYTLRAAALDNLPAGLTPYLRDAQTGQTLALTVGSSYSFQVTAAEATALVLGRFTLAFRTTGPLAATPAALAAQVLVYPNPAHDRVSVALPGIAGASAVQAELLSTLGQVVRRQSAALPASGTTLSVATEGLAPGVYMLRLSAGPATLTKRLVIE